MDGDVMKVGRLKGNANVTAVQQVGFTPNRSSLMFIQYMTKKRVID